jgi:hypothetical protein
MVHNSEGHQGGTIRHGASIFPVFECEGLVHVKTLFSLQCGPRKGCTGTSGCFWAPRSVLSQPRAVLRWICPSGSYGGRSGGVFGTLTYPHLILPYSAYYGHLASHYGGPWCPDNRPHYGCSARKSTAESPSSRFPCLTTIAGQIIYYLMTMYRSGAGRSDYTAVSYTRLQNVRLKNLSFLAKSKNRYFCLFFRANLTVLGVLVGSAG